MTVVVFVAGVWLGVLLAVLFAALLAPTVQSGSAVSPDGGRVGLLTGAPVSEEFVETVSRQVVQQMRNQGRQ